MTAKSKGWNWSVVSDSIWTEPSEDIYYYLDRWKKLGYQRFLDLGCGLGRHSLLFAEQGFETDGFDLSQDGLNKLKAAADERSLNIRIALGDINKLPYDSDTFDCLLAYHVISHTDTQGIVGIVSEIERVLRPGGEFFVTLCSKQSPSFQAGIYPKIDENTIIKTAEPEVGVPHFYSDLDDVQRIFSGFELISIRQIEEVFITTNSWHYFIHGRKHD